MEALKFEHKRSMNYFNKSGTRILGTFDQVPEEIKEEVFTESRFHGLDSSIYPFALGCSDLSSVIGINPWTSARDLYMTKTKKARSEMNSAMESGKRYEADIREAFSRVTGFTVQPCLIQVSNDSFPHIICNADGFLWDSQGKLCLLEIKTISADNIKAISQWKKGIVPPYYITQIQASMKIYNIDTCYIVVGYGLRDENIAYVKVSLDDELAELILDAGENYVLSIEAGIIPSINGTSYEMIKSKIVEFIGEEGLQKEAFLPNEKYITNTVNSVIVKHNKSLELTNKSNKLKKESDMLKKEILEEMADIFEAYGGILKCPVGTITLAVTKRETIDKDLLKQRHPEIYKEVLKTSQSESFKIIYNKKKKGDIYDSL